MLFCTPPLPLPHHISTLLPLPVKFFCHSISRHPNLYCYSKSKHSNLYSPIPTPLLLHSTHHMEQAKLSTPSALTVCSPTSISSATHKRLSHLLLFRKRPSFLRPPQFHFRNWLIVNQDGIPTHPSSYLSAPIPTSLKVTADIHPTQVSCTPLPHTPSQYIPFPSFIYIIPLPSLLTLTLLPG